MFTKLPPSQDNIMEIQHLYQSGFSVKKIAEMFGVGQTTMFRFFDKNGIQTRTRNEAYEIKRLSSDQEKMVWDLYYNSGLNREGIAEKLGFSYYSVRSVIDGNCLPGKAKFKLNMEQNTVPLTYEQKQLILGSLLGDAHLACMEHNGCQDQLEFSIVHGEPQFEYIRYIANLLGANVGKSIQSESSKGAGNPIYRLSYSNKYELLKLHSISFRDGRKTITKEWLKEIDALAISYWFMDDGSSTYSNGTRTVSILFATQSFNKDENDMLRDKLSNYGLDTTLHKANGGTNINIYLRQRSVNKFMDIVDPYISIIPCMAYKIKRKH